jgi:hypothetical protein
MWALVTGWGRERGVLLASGAFASPNHIASGRRQIAVFDSYSEAMSVANAYGPEPPSLWETPGRPWPERVLVIQEAA